VQLEPFPPERALGVEAAAALGARVDGPGGLIAGLDGLHDHGSGRIGTVGGQAADVREARTGRVSVGDHGVADLDPPPAPEALEVAFERDEGPHRRGDLRRVQLVVEAARRSRTRYGHAEPERRRQ